jgi:hypothetical protein
LIDFVVLPLYVEVNIAPKRTILPMAQTRDYSLALDGPLFRRQRQLLLKILDFADRRKPLLIGPVEERRHLEGLIELLDALADQAHDRYGIDCLIEEHPSDNNGNGR